MRMRSRTVFSYFFSALLGPESGHDRRHSPSKRVSCLHLKAAAPPGMIGIDLVSERRDAVLSEEHWTVDF